MQFLLPWGCYSNVHKPLGKVFVDHLISISLSYSKPYYMGISIMQLQNCYLVQKEKIYYEKGILPLLYSEVMGK